MYSIIYFIGMVLATFQLQTRLISGTFIVTETPRQSPLHIPNLVKLSQSRRITINWVKAYRFCADIYFARDTRYPIAEDTHVFICHPNNIWRMRIGLYHLGNIIAHAEKFDTPILGEPIYGISIIFDDNSNSLAVVQEDSLVIFNHTADPKTINFRDCRWYAHSGHAQWDVVTDDF